jgi:hypothetical protein
MVVLLVMYTFSCPLLIVAYVSSEWVAVTLSCISVCTYWTINEVARDLEDPFLYEPNEFPLATLLFTYNEQLMAQLGGARPACVEEGGRVCSLGTRRRMGRMGRLNPTKSAQALAGMGGGGSASSSPSRQPPVAVDIAAAGDQAAAAAAAAAAGGGGRRRSSSQGGGRDSWAGFRLDSLAALLPGRQAAPAPPAGLVRDAESPPLPQHVQHQRQEP